VIWRDLAVSYASSKVQKNNDVYDVDIKKANTEPGKTKRIQISNFKNLNLKSNIQTYSNLQHFIEVV
jgi:hypothetical protein